MLKNASNASAQCTQCVNDAAAARVESAREDTKTCVACELVLRKECFSDRMWASVAALHRKCKRCIAESTTDTKTCVVCEMAEGKTRIRLAFTSGWRFHCCVCAGRRMASTAICCQVMVANSGGV